MTAEAPPSDRAAEQCVLGGMLLAPAAIAEVADIGLLSLIHI